MFQMDLTTRAALHLSRLERLGYDVMACDDFEQIESYVQSTGKPLRSPMFDTRRNDFTEGRAFWLFLKKGDEVIGGLAAQLVALGDERFEDYAARVAGPQFGLEAPLKSVARPIQDRLAGNLIYFGELHLSEGARGRRRVLREYARLAIVLAAMSWPQFDWMYAIIPYNQRSLQDIYGFSLITHHALQWNEPKPYLYSNDQAMIYLSRADLLHQLVVREPD